MVILASNFRGESPVSFIQKGDSANSRGESPVSFIQKGDGTNSRGESSVSFIQEGDSAEVTIMNPVIEVAQLLALLMDKLPKLNLEKEGTTYRLKLQYQVQSLGVSDGQEKLGFSKGSVAIVASVIEVIVLAILGGKGNENSLTTARDIVNRIPQLAGIWDGVTEGRVSKASAEASEIGRRLTELTNNEANYNIKDPMFQALKAAAQAQAVVGA